MDNYFSVRMRASRGGIHISGAERIVRAGETEEVAAGLVHRARTHPRGVPDSITVTIDALAGKPFQILPALPVTTLEAGDAEAGRSVASMELKRAGVPGEVADKALSIILAGAVEGGAMRGAIIMDAGTGERLEPEPSGVRARVFDYDRDFIPELDAGLRKAGLDNTHIREALALASKTARAPGILAEVCISDDPDYLTGYVGSPERGYVRITNIKKPGSLSGGRVFFVDPRVYDPDAFIRFMRETPVIISGPLVIEG